MQNTAAGLLNKIQVLIHDLMKADNLEKLKAIQVKTVKELEVGKKGHDVKKNQKHKIEPNTRKRRKQEVTTSETRSTQRQELCRFGVT